MRKHIFLISSFLAFILLTGFIYLKSDKPLKNGDIVFIVNPSGQGKAIQLATKSKYTHVGIVLIENGKTMVYHAVEPVSKNTFDEFVDMSADGKFYIKRLKDQSLLTEQSITKMLAEAKSQLGIHYDLGFNWSDEELYCSEFAAKFLAPFLRYSMPTKPMHFEVNRDFWLKYFHGNPPDGAPGTSPGDFERSPLFKKIGFI